MAEYARSTRLVSVTVCTSSPEDNVQALLILLKGMTDHIKNVTYYKLPYNGIDRHRFTKEDHVDVMILCHSIQNRRFAITDVHDALYDKFLLNCQKSIGKEKMAVIVHDIENMSNEDYSDRISNFQQAQPTVFARASLVTMYGNLGEGGVLTKSFTDLINFLKEASQQPEEMKSSKMPSLPFTFGGSRSGHKTATAPAARTEDADLVELGTTKPFSERPLAPTHQTSTRSLLPSLNTKLPIASHPGRVDSSQPHQGSLSRRPISVSVCTSAFEHNVAGFMSWLGKLKADQPQMIADVRFRNLPYNNIDSFKFPSNDPVDVMVLCHSVHNRGFSITDVMNAVYTKYLAYCFKEMGKKKMAVIVHDLTGFNPTVVDPGKIATFRTNQPSTFKLVDSVIVCGSLENPNMLQMTEADMGKLFFFFESASSYTEPRKAETPFGKLMF